MRLTSRFDLAIITAGQLHRGQVRKGTRTPYISHPMAVAALVLEHGGTETEAIAALLHDAAEDSGGEAVLTSIIRPIFGKQVASIVRACSDSLTPTDEEKAPWRERKEKHLSKMQRASRSAKLVMAADKLHNARSITADLTIHGPKVWARFKGRRDGTLWYYAAAGRALKWGARATRHWSMACELESIVVGMALDNA